MVTRWKTGIVVGAAVTTLALVANGCAQKTLAVETGHKSQGGYVMIPSDTPTSREWRILPPPGTPSERQDTAGVPGGKRIFARYCASCHSRDGEGHGDASASPPVPDLVAFGARITEPFVYDDGQLPTDLGERKARLARISPQHTALQEGAGPYAG
ncbi:MAG: c-type cytochrome, partial [Armatimonadetes bacterium]|nr:c-type cytochrome [Armatimonadota bacterium]